MFSAMACEVLSKGAPQGTSLTVFRKCDRLPKSDVERRREVNNRISQLFVVTLHTTMQIFPCPSESRSKQLLTECGLTTKDLQSSHFENFLGWGSTATDTRGIVGLEFFGNVALLRSLAVTREARGLGGGKALVQEAESYARHKGVRKLFLLTITAQRFFEALGYTIIERTAAPEPIKGTPEFSTLCPASAVLMVKELESLQE